MSDPSLFPSLSVFSLSLFSLIPQIALGSAAPLARGTDANLNHHSHTLVFDQRNAQGSVAFEEEKHPFMCSESTLQGKESEAF